MTNLSETFVKSLKWEGKDKRIGDGQGLYLNLRKNSKTWIIRKSHQGKTQIITLGKWPALSCKRARLQAARLILEEDVSNVTVKKLVDKYISEVVRPTHKRPDFPEAYFKNAVIPAIGHKKVRDIKRVQLVYIIQSYVPRGPRAADQLRSQLKKAFSYAVELGYIDDNPMLDVSRRISGYQPKARDRVLTGDEIKWLWSLDHGNARVLKFLVLTGLRISEAQNGFLKDDRWMVPAEISKNGRPYWVYLTKTAREQLPLPHCSPTNIQAWLKRSLNKEGYITETRFTPHDLRRTAATRMADNGVEPFIVERVLNHTLEGVMAVYNRAEYAEERIEAVKVLEKAVLKCTGRCRGN